MLSAVVAVGTYASGISGNWIAGLGQPPDAVVWTVSAVAAAAAVVFAVLSFRAGRDESDGAPVSVSVVGPADSADTGWDVWPLAEFTPALATVHPAIGRRSITDEARPGEAPQPTPYVTRTHDAALRADLAAAARGEHRALVLLRGGSSTGKTRSLYEAAHATCTTPLPAGAHGRRQTGWQVVRPAGREALRELPSAGVLDRAPTVLWLNELQGFLGPNGTGLTRRLLAELHDAAAGKPLLLVGTVWPGKLSDQSRTEHESTRDTRELLADRTQVRVHEIIDRLEGAELDAAQATAQQTGDARVVAALEDRGGLGFTQALAGAAELLDTYRGANRGVRLVLEAAGDYRRLGGQSALSPALLVALASALWQDAYAPQAPNVDQLAEAVLVASQPLRDPDGGVRALVPMEGNTYTLSDFLEDTLANDRAARVVGDLEWEALRDLAAPADLLTLADAAGNRGRFAVEGRLLSRAFDTRVNGSRSKLAEWLDDRGQLDDAERMWWAAVNAHERYAHGRFVHRLESHGRYDEAEQVLRKGAAAGLPRAHTELAWWLGDQGRHDEAIEAWRAAVRAHESFATEGLVEALDKSGQHDAAEQVWRDASSAAEPQAHVNYGWWLKKQRRDDEAEPIWRAALAASEKEAFAGLAMWLEDHHREDEVELVFRDAIDAGEELAHTYFATFLEARGRMNEAEQVCWDAIPVGAYHADDELASRLTRWGRFGDAEQVLRDAKAAGRDKGELLRFLEDQGRNDEAEQLMRDAISSDTDNDARTALAFALTTQGRFEEAERTLREAVTAHRGDPHVVLGHWLSARGAHAEAERVLRKAVIAGESDAFRGLTRWLVARDRGAEAAVMRTHGVDAYGDTMWS